jgi:hypothetical protein
VTPRDATTQDWEVEMAGRAQRWETRVEAHDQRHVAWRTTGTPHAEGDVELKPVEGGQTLVTLRLTYHPEGEHDTEGSGGMVDRLVMNSLERFKAYAEPREHRRMADEDAPPPRGAQTVDGPDGERGGPLQPDAGDLPFSEHGRRHGEPMRAAGADTMGTVSDRRELDVNAGDNEAEWSRTDTGK